MLLLLDRCHTDGSCDVVLLFNTCKEDEMEDEIFLFVSSSGVSLWSLSRKLLFGSDHVDPSCFQMALLGNDEEEKGEEDSNSFFLSYFLSIFLSFFFTASPSISFT